MSTKLALFLLALVSSNLALSITERIQRKREEIPCNREAVEALRRMGLQVEHIRCYSQNQARSFRFSRDDSERRKTSKRSSCCGPECEWMIKTAGVDPSTVSCPSKE
ncbi:uncharacterized protein LOC116304236 [Actinia tenebrosa]|uniref:Uncharacterized protein LOC116304236 n=1 Tax=Actinia tenebrosa TaxID=6105 RepID=A0A6P8ISD3_ACTTE|nr:uncharacterized protein LOC116304236 [Actinia tenebrosa]